MKILRVYETDLATGEQQPQPAGEPPPARARRADRLGRAHRQGRARRSVSVPPRPPHADDHLRDAPAPLQRRARGRTAPREPGPPSASARAYLRAGAAGGLPRARLRDALRRRARDAARPDRRDARLPARATSTRTRAARHVELLAAWLGVELDESWTRPRSASSCGTRPRPRAARHAKGLELALRIAFPDLPLRVEDEGGVVFTRDADSEPAHGGEPLRRLLRRADPGRAPGGRRAHDRGAEAGARRLPAAGQGTAGGRGRVSACPSCGSQNPEDATSARTAASTCAGIRRCTWRPCRPAPPRRPGEQRRRARSADGAAADRDRRARRRRRAA